MKKTMISGLLFLFCISSYSQNLDLIVTSSGDSLACKIDSVTESKIYLHIKITESKKWIYTYYEKENILKYEFGSIIPKKYAYEEGTSKITGKNMPDISNRYIRNNGLEKASEEQLLYHLEKAQKKKKTGKTMFLTGLGAVGLGAIMISQVGIISDESTFPAIMVMGGIISTLAGIQFKISGTKREEILHKALYSNLGEISMEISPCTIHNYQAQNYQPGVMLRLRF